ncbi:hypothetical protein FRC02_010855 [Tulasnella sp. 418]|nr:hypothetical protein FRC02_010855 [Tulasnella sp. 418]
MRGFTTLVFTISTLLLPLTSAAPTQPESEHLEKRAQPEGVDVNQWQGNVNWPQLWNWGATYAYVKATEGANIKNQYYNQQYTGSYNAGMIHGAYHQARPDKSSGKDQANYFYNNGGKWTADGKTLPGALYLDYNPSGDPCYGLNQWAMGNWVHDFSDYYHDKTGRYPTIYTSTAWWKQCTGNNDSFGSNHALWIKKYSSWAGELPAGWDKWSFWQYTKTGPYVPNHDKWNGDYDGLVKYARGW